MTTITTPLTQTPQHKDPTWGATLASEWSKLRTARSPRRNLLFGIGLGIALSVLIAWVTGATFGDWSASDQAAFNPINYAISGSILTVIFFAAVGVNAMASEHASGMIRLTFTVTPRRHRVVLAKAAVVALVTAVASAVTMIGMIGFSQLIYGAYDLPTASLFEGDALWLVAGIALTGPMFPVLAVALTAVLRTTGASLSAVLALIFAPSIIGSFLPRWWQENVIAALPGPASDAVVMNHIVDSDNYLPTGLAVVVCVAWVVVALTLAIRIVDRRDA